MRLHLNNEHDLKNILKDSQQYQKYVLKDLCIQHFLNTLYKKYFLIKYQEQVNFSINVFKEQISTIYFKDELNKVKEFEKKKTDISAN